MGDLDAEFARFQAELFETELAQEQEIQPPPTLPPPTLAAPPMAPPHLAPPPMGGPPHHVGGSGPPSLQHQPPPWATAPPPHMGGPPPHGAFHSQPALAPPAMGPPAGVRTAPATIAAKPVFTATLQREEPKPEPQAGPSGMGGGGGPYGGGGFHAPPQQHGGMGGPPSPFQMGGPGGMQQQQQPPPRGQFAAAPHAPPPAVALPNGAKGVTAIVRSKAGHRWMDPTLLDWPENDFRIFVGNLGNEASDATLTQAFQKYSSFHKAKVVRYGHNNKTRGFGFVSLLDIQEGAKALKEMQGKYIGNRPVQLKRSNWADRNETDRKGNMKKRVVEVKPPPQKGFHAKRQATGPGPGPGGFGQGPPRGNFQHR